MFGTKYFSEALFRRTPFCGFEAIQTGVDTYLQIPSVWKLDTYGGFQLVQQTTIPLSVSWLPLQSVAVWEKHREQRCSASSSALPRADTYTWSAESLPRLLWLAEVSVGWVRRHPIHMWAPTHAPLNVSLFALYSRDLSNFPMWREKCYSLRGHLKAACKKPGASYLPLVCA